MKNVKNIFQPSKEAPWIIGISAMILIFAFVFREPLYGIFGEENYVVMHLIMEFFIITISLTIAIQSWMAFPHVLSSTRLGIGALFFAVGIIEIAHTVTFTGMPFFISESNPYKATWFFMIARLTQVIGLLFIVSRKDKLVLSVRRRLLSYIVAFLYSCIWLFIVFYPTPLLPELVQEGIGTTSIKNNLQYLGILLELIVMYFVITRFRSKEFFNLMLVMASVYFIIADFTFTTYKSVFDINNFLGHLFQIAGMYFMQRAVYHTSVVEPFEKQKETEQELQNHKQYLETITSHMGEGLIVTDLNEKITYMNFEAGNMLQYTLEEVLGKNIYKVIYKERDQYPPLFSRFSDYEIKPFRIKKDIFTRHDHSTFSTDYVVTPLIIGENLNGCIIVFRDITQQENDQKKIHSMAYYDELTGLPNLRYLKEKLATIILLHPQQKFAIFELDINRFKNINEALGHTFGDTMLRAVGERLQQVMSNGMILGRVTSDRFCMIMPFTDLNEVNSIIEKIQNLLAEPVNAQNLLLNVTLNMGISVYPDHGKDGEQLLQCANTALMESKQRKIAYQYYQQSLSGKALERLMFENDLYHALARNELHVLYQPQIDNVRGQIIGVEALIRWKHPVHGEIPPNNFISIAEETGLIIPIGEWVLRTACRQTKEWHNQGIFPLNIGVNLSIRQFYQENLIDVIKEILEETQLDPKYLDIEITESMMMNFEHTEKKLQELKGLGVKVSVDDFGTGYSSLSYLKNLPVDRLKIDKSFIHNIFKKTQQADTSIVSLIIGLAYDLNLEVIAEGVETNSQRDVLKGLQCGQIQGFLISKPITAEKFVETWTRKHEESSIAP